MENYLAIVTRNLVTAAAQGNLIVRHLLLPGHFDCCFRPIVSWLRAQPARRQVQHPRRLLAELAGGPSRRARPAARAGRGRPRARLRIPRRVEGHRMKLCDKNPPESVDESTESEITIQPDGRIFAFGITKSLAAVLRTIPTADDRMKSLLDRISGLGW